MKSDGTNLVAVTFIICFTIYKLFEHGYIKM